MSLLLIKDGTVVNPIGEKGRLDVLIQDDKIVAIAQQIDVEADTVIDAFGRIVAPGLVDVHSHFRDPGQLWKEDIFTGAEAAKRGGYTSIVMMANTVPPIDNVDTLNYALERGARTGINIYTHAAITVGMEGRKLTDMVKLYQAGAVGFSDDGKPVLDEGLLREAMTIAAQLKVPISLHEEDPAYIKTPGYNMGYASRKLGVGGADREAEISMIERDIELALETGARVNFQHVSTAEGVRLIHEGQLSGGDIHGEATPHHFSLSEEDVIELGTLGKVNPPIRTEDDREAIVRGLQDWTLDMIATDHAPHSRDEKMSGLLTAPSGVIGLETALALGITNLVEKKYLSIHQLIMAMSTNPAQIYGLDAGALSVGSSADIVVFDQYCSRVVGVHDFVSRSSNSPFIGKRLQGKVKCTICGGKIAYQNNCLF